MGVLKKIGKVALPGLFEKPAQQYRRSPGRLEGLAHQEAVNRNLGRQWGQAHGSAPQAGRTVYGVDRYMPTRWTSDPGRMMRRRRTDQERIMDRTDLGVDKYMPTRWTSDPERMSHLTTNPRRPWRE